MKKKILITSIIVIIFLVVFFFLQALLVPKFVENNKEGALVREYYDNASQNDILFLGDCEVYSTFSPVRIWEKYGITSYVRGSANQTIWQSYYLLEDTLRYETPKVVVFNVLSMKYSEPIKEEYNRLTLEGMKWSASKYNAIKASMTEDESLISYILPILRYHDRYDELSEEDLKYIFSKPEISYMGYLMRKEVVPYKTLPHKIELTNYRFDDICYEYLDKMVSLCEENEIKLVLVKAPTLYPYWYDEWDEQIEEFAKENELTYINMLSINDEIGIDYSRDTYDGGLHLNVSGVEKVSDYFGKWLEENISFEKDYDNHTIERFDNALKKYNEEKAK